MKNTEHIHYETELPEGYEEVYTVDAKDKKTAIVMNIVATAVAMAFIVSALFIIRPFKNMDDFSLAAYLVFIASMIGYIVLHELTHGAAYKLLTGRKLTFGMTLSVAYCGVPDIYVYRTAALISLLAPFVVFNVVFLGAALAFTNPWWRTFAWMQFGLHFGGCAGDLYDTWLYLTRFRDPKTLMRDTGPKQTFYQKK